MFDGIRALTRRLLLLVAAVALCGGAASADAPPLDYQTPGAVPLLAPGYAAGTRVVTIADASLQPRRIELDVGERVAWESRAPEGMRISFGAEVARAMVCTSLVNFSIEDGRLRSGMLRPGDRASFCHLGPGRYRYRVERSSDSDRRMPLGQRIEGEIVVRQRTAATEPPPAGSRDR
jgi:hypothetical protein